MSLPASLPNASEEDRFAGVGIGPVPVTAGAYVSRPGTEKRSGHVLFPLPSRAHEGGGRVFYFEFVFVCELVCARERPLKKSSARERPLKKSSTRERPLKNASTRERPLKNTSTREQALPEHDLPRFAHEKGAGTDPDSSVSLRHAGTDPLREDQPGASISDYDLDLTGLAAAVIGFYRDRSRTLFRTGINYEYKAFQRIVLLIHRGAQ